MKFEWSAYVELAQRLVKLASDISISQAEQEAMLRSAISRAYYAVFVLARNHLIEKDGDKSVPKLGDVHGYVIDSFRYSPNGLRRTIGWKLYFLRRYRNYADYEDQFPNLFANAHNAVKEARRVISALAKLK